MQNLPMKSNNGKCYNGRVDEAGGQRPGKEAGTCDGVEQQLISLIIANADSSEFIGFLCFCLSHPDKLEQPQEAFSEYLHQVV